MKFSLGVFFEMKPASLAVTALRFQLQALSKASVPVLQRHVHSARQESHFNFKCYIKGQAFPPRFPLIPAPPGTALPQTPADARQTRRCQTPQRADRKHQAPGSTWAAANSRCSIRIPSAIGFMAVGRTCYITRWVQRPILPESSVLAAQLPPGSPKHRAALVVQHILTIQLEKQPPAPPAPSPLSPDLQPAGSLCRPAADAWHVCTRMWHRGDRACCQPAPGPAV